MREDRLNWASGTERHAEIMFKETKNPYYVVAAIAAARIAEWKIPEWAIDELTKAAQIAWRECGEPGGQLSIDAALGIRTKKGGTPVKKLASRASIERGVFKLIKTIHYCFDVSIPVACEVAHAAIAYEFVKDTHEWLPSPGDPFYSDEQMEQIGLTRSELKDVREKERARTERIIESDSNTEVVKAKFYSHDYWSITHGDRLGYSLEKLIDTYYRRGGKVAFQHNDKMSQIDMIFWEGCFLLMSGHLCTHRITPRINPPDGEYPFSCVSAVAGLPLKVEFKKFRDRFSKVFDRSVPKSLVSGQ